jgi:hypothetical protein
LFRGQSQQGADLDPRDKHADDEGEIATHGPLIVDADMPALLHKKSNRLPEQLPAIGGCMQSVA